MAEIVIDGESFVCQSRVDLANARRQVYNAGPKTGKGEPFIRGTLDWEYTPRETLIRNGLKELEAEIKTMFSGITEEKVYGAELVANEFPTGPATIRTKRWADEQEAARTKRALTTDS